MTWLVTQRSGEPSARDNDDGAPHARRTRPRAALCTPGEQAERIGEDRRGHGPSTQVVERRHRDAVRALNERNVAQWLQQRTPGRPGKRKATDILEEVARRVRARSHPVP